jgi:hypothetical protein
MQTDFMALRFCLQVAVCQLYHSKLSEQDTWLPTRSAVTYVDPLPRSTATEHLAEPIARHELMVASIVFYGGICMIYLRTIVK